jgi:hypothetical protein
MIRTQLINESPIVVLHRISGRLNEANARSGAKKAMSIINNINFHHQMYRLLLDLSDYKFDNLASHKIWSLGFKEQPSLEQNLEFTAIVGDGSPHFLAEKKLMESEKLKFFTNVELATTWLREA